MLDRKRKKGVRTEEERQVDFEIGKRLLALRQIRGLSQEELATQIGISFQQVQKYENGINRIAANRLLTFSRILDVSPLYFFKGQ